MLVGFRLKGPNQIRRMAWFLCDLFRDSKKLLSYWRVDAGIYYDSDNQPDILNKISPFPRGSRFVKFDRKGKFHQKSIKRATAPNLVEDEDGATWGEVYVAADAMIREVIAPDEEEEKIRVVIVGFQPTMEDDYVQVQLMFMVHEREHNGAPNVKFGQSY